MRHGMFIHPVTKILILLLDSTKCTLCEAHESHLQSARMIIPIPNRLQFEVNEDGFGNIIA